MRDVDAQAPAKRHRMSAEQRRESILKAAVEVFTAAGYRAGKVSDVAARVGVTEPVIFQNFGSKAALFAAVLDRVAADLRAELDTLVERHGSAAELLAHVLGARPAGRAHPDRTQPGQPPPDRTQPGRVHSDRTQPGQPHPPDQRGAEGPLFADAISLTAESEPSEPGRRILRTLADHLADLLRRGQADGDIRADLDAEAGAWLMLSILAARPLRAAMPEGARLDSGVSALALQAVIQPRPADRPS